MIYNDYKQIVRQLEHLAEKLASKVRPGHVAYISKKDASDACLAIANELTDRENALFDAALDQQSDPAPERIVITADTFHKLLGAARSAYDQLGSDPRWKVENIRSVSARYPQDTWETLPGPIVKDLALLVTDRDFAELSNTNPVTILKLCDCLEYQSCETEDWEETPAHELLQRIRKAAIRTLPGYEDAPWGY